MGTKDGELSGLAPQTGEVTPATPAVVRPLSVAADAVEERYDPLDDTGITNPNIQGGHALAQWRHAHGR